MCAFQFAVAYAYREELDKAFEWLERGVALRDAGIPATRISQFFKKLRSDPRWPAFQKKVGFPE